VNVTVTIYQVKENARLTWTTLGLGEHAVTETGAHPARLQKSIADALRGVIMKLKPRELEAFEMVRGTRLETVHLELSLRHEGKKRKLSLVCPIVIEPRWASGSERFTVAYHPARQGEWFPYHDDAGTLAEQATAYFTQAWATLNDEDVERLRLRGKALLKSFAFSVTPRSLLDDLPDRKKGIWDDLKNDERTRDEKKPRHGGYKILPSLGVNLTQKAIEGAFSGGTPRLPCREQLRMLLSGSSQQSTLVVGASGAGKTTAIERWVLDQLVTDDYASHRNADRVRAVWRLSGKRIIAGMSYLGDWQKRCFEVIEDVRARRCILYVEDLHLFGRIGQSRESEMNLAEFFRGPVARREVTMVGECTPEQLRQLEEDAPAFATLFTRVHLPPTDAAETFRMLVQEVRRLEPQYHVEIAPTVLRAVLDLGASLFPTRAFPGKALDLLRRVTREHTGAPESPRPITYWDFMQFLSDRTGLSDLILHAEYQLAPDDVRDWLKSKVMGQPEAVEAMVDLVMRVRTGLIDSRRPFGVYLFTGPTGTGKTELARALVQYLYSDAKRFARFDMGEFSTPDAAARLVGDRWNPEGLLTRQALQQPFCVVLLDEIEKAHPQVHNLLLQLFDDGRLTDASGATASFAHTVIIMTSNLGAQAGPRAGFGADDLSTESDHLRAVREFFAPELFNRIDRVVSFKPLSPAVARDIVAKELASLTARRGLVDRNVFVSAAPEVLDRIVREAFRAADGARSLKRYLEDRIGTLLTEHLVGGRRADVQLVQVRDRGATGFALDVESLQEAAPLETRFALEPVATASAARLRREISEARRFLEGLVDSNELAALSDEVREHLAQHKLGTAGHADPLYTLDALRGQLTELRSRLEELERATREGDDWEDFALREFRYEDRPTGEWSGTTVRYRTFDPRAITPAGGRPARMVLLAALAETWALRRALRLARDPTQHAVFIEVERVGMNESDGQGWGLMSDLVAAYVQARGELEDAAVRYASGTVASRWTRFELTHPSDSNWPEGSRHCVVKLVGLCVRDFFELETGTHLWHSLASAPDIVRVRVRPAAPGERAEDVIMASLESRKRDDSPREELPVVRSIRFDWNRQENGYAPLELEDYVMSISRVVSANRLSDPLPGLWLVRLSRED